MDKGIVVSLFADNSFAWNFAVTNGLNTFTAIAQDALDARALPALW
jgi:hypothetical protein